MLPTTLTKVVTVTIFALLILATHIPDAEAHPLLAFLTLLPRPQDEAQPHTLSARSVCRPESPVVPVSFLWHAREEGLNVTELPPDSNCMFAPCFVVNGVPLCQGSDRYVPRTEEEAVAMGNLKDWAERKEGGDKVDAGDWTWRNRKWGATWNWRPLHPGVAKDGCKLHCHVSYKGFWDEVKISGDHCPALPVDKAEMYVTEYARNKWTGIEGVRDWHFETHPEGYSWRKHKNQDWFLKFKKPIGALTQITRALKHAGFKDVVCDRK